MIALLLLALLGGEPGATAVPVAAELERLAGHRVTVHGDRYTIEDVAGEGPPRVGVVERRERELWLVEQDGSAVRLAGVLAIPRIAGPGYKVWALGDIDPETGALVARRLGVLAPPARL